MLLIHKNLRQKDCPAPNAAYFAKLSIIVKVLLNMCIYNMTFLSVTRIWFNRLQHFKLIAFVLEWLEHRSFAHTCCVFFLN
jgi:uncharacterized membrane protein